MTTATSSRAISTSGGTFPTSAKTLDTQAFGYLDRPSRIFGQLRRYVDQVDQFDSDKKRDMAFDGSEIFTKRMDVAVPLGTSLEQIVQIQRAIDYAAALGIEMKVRFIK